ncbi:MAG: hypothetical protein HY897_21010 [Deltaproteobacteria bacterium]|nr:hypothetical protein [Deltaproteobacteria bacterium]
MRTAAFLVSMVLLTSGTSALAAETAAVFAHGSDDLADDLLVKFRSVLAERLRTAGFLVVEVRSLDGPESFMKSLDGSVGRHGSYRLFGVNVSGSGPKLSVKIVERNPRSLAETDSINVLAADPAEFDRLLPMLLGTFVRGAAPADTPGKPEARPPARVPEPVVSAPYGPPEPVTGRAVPGQLCMKEPGELYWGLGVMTGKGASDDAEGALGGMLRFAYEMRSVRIDVTLDGMGGGSTSFVEFGAAADYLFSTGNTAFYLGGGLAVMRIDETGGRHVEGSGVGAGVQGGVEFLRHHSARFLVEGRFVLPFFALETSNESYDTYMPLGFLSLQLLW